jgi:hypothetical protein
VIVTSSHAWFNDGLFTGRWISEGQADTCAAVTSSLGQNRAAAPFAGDEARSGLGSAAADHRRDRARERTPNAAWFVTSSLYDEIGPDRMREIFRAADQNLTAYPGANPAEPVAAADDWRRYLDLLEELGGSTTAEDLFREYVVTPTATRELDARTTAREAYAVLIDEGGDWAPPSFVRGELGAWRFASARSRITEAEEILALRGEVAAAATALGLEPDDALESAYESAVDNFVEAQDIAHAEITVLDTLAATDAAVDAPSDFVSTVGLIGVSPRTGFEAAGAAFEAGDLEAAEAAARGALALVTEAPRVGRERLLGAVGVAFGGTTLIGIGIVIRGRRRTRRAGPGQRRSSDRARRRVRRRPRSCRPRSCRRSCRPLEPYGTLAADSPAPRPMRIARAIRTGCG